MAELIDLPFALWSGLECAEECTSSIVFAMWCQCALMGEHLAATWRIRLNHPSMATMRLCQITLTTCYLCRLHAHLESRTDSQALQPNIVAIPYNTAI